jgi:hypothetical protein
MRLPELLVIVIFAITLPSCFFYLFFCLKKYRQLIALVGLFSLAMGFFLLVLDLVLITFTHGIQYIPDYLLFNRLVSDTGFAGRWVLTVYVFIGTGIVLAIYLLARNLITKFNKRK